MADQNTSVQPQQLAAQMLGQFGSQNRAYAEQEFEAKKKSINDFVGNFLTRYGPDGAARRIPQMFQAWGQLNGIDTARWFGPSGQPLSYDESIKQGASHNLLTNELADFASFGGGTNNQQTPQQAQGPAVEQGQPVSFQDQTQQQAPPTQPAVDVSNLTQPAAGPGQGFIDLAGQRLTSGQAPVDPLRNALESLAANKGGAAFTQAVQGAKNPNDVLGAAEKAYGLPTGDRIKQTDLAAIGNYLNSGATLQQALDKVGKGATNFNPDTWAKSVAVQRAYGEQMSGSGFDPNFFGVNAVAKQQQEAATQPQTPSAAGVQAPRTTPVAAQPATPLANAFSTSPASAQGQTQTTSVETKTISPILKAATAFTGQFQDALKSAQEASDAAQQHLSEGSKGAAAIQQQNLNKSLQKADEILNKQQGQEITDTSQAIRELSRQMQSGNADQKAQAQQTLADVYLAGRQLRVTQDPAFAATLPPDQQQLMMGMNDSTRRDAALQLELKKYPTDVKMQLYKMGIELANQSDDLELKKKVLDSNNYWEAQKLALESVKANAMAKAHQADPEAFDKWTKTQLQIVDTLRSQAKAADDRGEKKTSAAYTLQADQILNRLSIAQGVGSLPTNAGEQKQGLMSTMEGIGKWFSGTTPSATEQLRSGQQPGQASGTQPSANFAEVQRKVLGR